MRYEGRFKKVSDLYEAEDIIQGNDNIKAVIKRKGQVRDVRSPGDTYSGEATGINAKVVHSHRYK